MLVAVGGGQPGDAAVGGVTQDADGDVRISGGGGYPCADPVGLVEQGARVV
ncbi:hypothetical protein [Nocardia sp. NBC_00403]|uniref:hypothetical protein n=1 Tax=Nocardia sp. NBC_00403 TaxID=2975990 RepID=UPI002E1B6CB1